MKTWTDSLNYRDVILAMRPCQRALCAPEHEYSFLANAVEREWPTNIIQRHIKFMTRPLVTTSMTDFFQGVDGTQERIASFYYRAPPPYWDAIYESTEDTSPPGTIFDGFDVEAAFRARQSDMFGWNSRHKNMMKLLCTSDLRELLGVVCYRRWPGGNCHFSFVNAIINEALKRDVIGLEHLMGAHGSPVGKHMLKYVIRAHAGIGRDDNLGLPEYLLPYLVRQIKDRHELRAMLCGMEVGIIRTGEDAPQFRSSLMETTHVMALYNVVPPKTLSSEVNHLLTRVIHKYRDDNFMIPLSK